MALFDANTDGLLISILLMLGPWLYLKLKAGRQAHSTLHKAQRANASQSNTVNDALTAILILHNIILFYRLVFVSQQNLFRALRVPLSTPTEKIRQILLGYITGGLKGGNDDGSIAEAAQLPKHLERLLMKLSSFDVRTFYVRFGHNVVSNCEYCSSFNDFALFALPRPLIEYAREAALLGFLTLRGTGREKFRKWAVMALLSAALAEVYWSLTTDIRLPRAGEDTIMWHDTLWRIRQSLFLVLPTALYFFTPRGPNAPAPLQTTLMSLCTLQEQSESAMARAHLLKYTMGAASRVPELREAQTAFWEKEREEGQWAIEDEDLMKTAEGVWASAGRPGGGDTRGKLREAARTGVEALVQLFPKPEESS